jgi:hypothetical protein
VQVRASPKVITELTVVILYVPSPHVYVPSAGADAFAGLNTSPDSANAKLVTRLEIRIEIRRILNDSHV